MRSRKFNGYFLAKIGTASALMMLAAASYANTPPMIVNNCNFGNIIVPTAGQDYYFDQECATGYVAPPTVGTPVVKSYFENLNVGFCPTLVNAQTTTSSLELIRGDIAKKAAAQVALLDLTELRRLEGIKNAADAVAKAAKETLNAATAETARLADLILTTRAAYQTCSVLDTTGFPQTACAIEYGDWMAARTNYVAYQTSDYLPAVRADIAARMAFNIANAAWMAEDNAVIAVNNRIMQLNDLADAISARIDAVYSKYARMSGATASVLYSTNWGALVNAFATANAGNPRLANVTWKQMPIRNAKLTANLVAGSETVRDIPGLISAQIPGYAAFGTNLPNGNIPLPAPGTEAGYYNTASVFPAAFTAGMNLNLLTACPSVTRPAGSIPDLSSFLVLNLSASYDLMARVSYHASFNLNTFFQRLQSVSTSRHWFSSSTVRNLVETRSATENWTWKYTGDARALGSNADEQGSGEKALENSVRLRLYEHVLKNIGIAVPRTSTDAPGPVSLEPAPVGSFAIALRRTCGWGSYYTCYAGWIVGGLNSLFGSSNAENNFTSTNNSVATEDVSLVHFVKFDSNTTF